jgi:DEAD/DEAH box helicase domain-containing protein
MLPSHTAENIKRQVLFYLQSTLFFRDREVENAFLTTHRPCRSES